MNNGIMWFDPEAGHPNALAPGKRCQTNYCSIIAEHGDRRFALGTSGGRRILPAVTQLFSFLSDNGDTLETAFHRPRINSGERALVIGDTALDEEIHRALQTRFHYVQQHRLTFPFQVRLPKRRSQARKYKLGYGGNRFAVGRSRYRVRRKECEEKRNSLLKNACRPRGGGRPGS
jgi:Gamma-glutamyltranspeptidase